MKKKSPFDEGKIELDDHEVAAAKAIFELNAGVDRMEKSLFLERSHAMEKYIHKLSKMVL